MQMLGDKDTSKDDFVRASPEATYDRVFQLLSVHRIRGAVEIASKASLWRLSTLLAQTGGNDAVSRLLRRQMLDWSEYGAQTSISPSLLRIYKLMAGEEAILGDPGSDCILRNVSWLKAIALLFWYGGRSSTGKLKDALETYEKALDYDMVAPHRLHHGHPHAFFSILKLLLSCGGGRGVPQVDDVNKRSVLCDCLNGYGYAADPLDSRGPYLLLIVLEALGYVSRTSAVSAIVRSHMMFQLLSEGLWEWAVFLGLQLDDEVQRAAVVKDILGRHAGYEGWEKDESNKEHFVIQRLLVPASWIHEITAWRCRYEGRRYAEAAYLNLSGHWLEADKVVCDILAPAAVFASKSATTQLRELLVHMGAVLGESDQYCDSWERGGGLLLQYFCLQDDLKDVRQLQIENDAESEQVLISVICSAVAIMKGLVDTHHERGILSKRKSSIDGPSLRDVMFFDMGTYLFRILSECSLLVEPKLGEWIQAALAEFVKSVVVLDEIKFKYECRATIQSRN